MFERGGRLRALQGPATGLVAQVLLLAATTAIGVGSAGLVVGAACAVTLDGALARGLLRNPSERLGPAGWVTLGRATLAVGVAALTAESFFRDVPVAVLVALAAVALVLDYVDGWVARRTASASALGARLDGEVDAFLILVLSVYVAPTAGAWVLAIGAARYAFLVAGWLLRVDARAAAAARLAQGRRGDAGHHADDRRSRCRAPGPDAGGPRRRARPPRRIVRPRRLVALAQPACRPLRPGRAEARSPPAGRRPHGAGPPGRVGRPRGPEPAQASHTGRVREGPARGHRRHRAGPRPAGDRTAPPGLGGRPRARPPGHREAARLRLLHRLRPAVQPHRRLEVHLDRHRDAPRLDRSHRRQPRAGRSGAPLRRGARPPDPGGASPDPGRSPPPPVVAPGGGGPRRRVGALLGIRRGARLRRPHRLHERRRSGGPGGTRGAGRPARSSAVRRTRSAETATATRLAAGS